MSRTTTMLQPPNPISSPVDVLLADVAIRIQLSHTDYERATQRYRTINEWIERDGSPLKDRVQLFYPQGSMATGSTAASRLRTDEFDIDVAAQLDLPPDVPPSIALGLLYEAVRGEPGSRYYRVTKRRTRCVTIDYADNMHLDVTPMVRQAGTPERESVIFHHRAEAPHEPSYRLIANPYGFAEWFKETTPLDHDFSLSYQSRARDYERMIALMRADSEVVPPQEPPFRKSKAVIVLQLLKRWRNVQYDTRPGRRPPSILISKLVADSANATDSLSEELRHQARSMWAEFQRWHEAGKLIHVENPRCPQDVLTDRWPESLVEQAVFVDDLTMFVAKIERLVSGCALDEMRKIMIELFGETSTADVFRAFNRRQGAEIRHGQSQHVPGAGGLVVPAGVVAGSTAASPRTRPTPNHTFYGEHSEG